MTTHYLVAIILVVLLFLVTGANQPGMMQMDMSGSLYTSLLLVAAALVAVYAGLILAERGGDERDAAHRSIAGRVGYLVGIFTLAAALLVQGLSHAIDPWIASALSAMIVAKVAARAFASRNN